MISRGCTWVLTTKTTGCPRVLLFSRDVSALFMQAEQSAWSTRIYDDVSVLSAFKFHSEQAILVEKRRAVLLTFLLVPDLIYCCSLFNILNAGKEKREIYPLLDGFIGATLLAFCLLYIFESASSIPRNTCFEKYRGIIKDEEQL